MKSHFLLAMFGGVGLLVAECAASVPRVKYTNVNGMTIPKRCVAYVVYQGRDLQITLPSGGAGGTTISLGKLGLTDVTLQRATGTLQLCDYARMMCCENGRQAAYANDRVTYDKMRRAELAQATKLIQFVEIVVRQPTSNMPPPSESAKKEKEASVAAKKPGKKSLIEVTTKKPKVADINADVNKWVAAYKPSAEYQPSLSEQQVMMAQSHSSTGRTTTTTARVAATVAPSQQQMAGQITGRTTAAFTPIKAPATSTTTTTATKKGVNDVLSTPAKSNSYFGLPKE